MRSTLRPHCLSAALVGGGILLLSSSPARADEPAAIAEGSTKSELAPLDLLEGLRTGVVSVDAEGTGDGRMTLSVTNRSDRQLRVVLPPGLIASGATGQFGGMGGGMGGGGMGGMGGGGMGGMGGGGMGGGMGGMGGGMGGMGGGMGGGGMGMGGGRSPRRWG